MNTFAVPPTERYGLCRIFGGARGSGENVPESAERVQRALQAGSHGHAGARG